MSQVDTVTTPKFLTQLTTEDCGEFEYHVDDMDVYSLCWDDKLMLSLPEVANNRMTAAWADHCGFDTDILDMKAPFPFEDKVKQTWKEISQASGDTLCEVVRDCGGTLDRSSQKGGLVWQLTVNNGQHEQRQQMSFKVDATYDRDTGKYLASGVELSVAGSDNSFFHYGYRPGTHLLVEGLQMSTKTHYKFDAKPAHQHWYYRENPAE